MTSTARAARKTRFYYGWVILVVSCAAILVNSGVKSSFGVFLKPMAADMGWGRAGISAAVSISMIVFGVSQPMMGRLVDRYGTKAVVASGLLVTTLAFAPMALVTSPWQIYLLYGVIGSFGLGGAGVVPLTPIVTAWFVRHRATALSIASTGSALGQSIFVPLAAFLLGLISWRMTYLVIAGLMLFGVLPMVVLFLRGMPTEAERLRHEELWPQGVRSGKAASVRPLPGVAPTRAMRTWPFILLSTGFFSCGFTATMVFTHLFALGTDAGLSEMVAANALSVIGVFALVGTLGIGSMSDRVGPRRPLAAVYLLRSAAMVALVTFGNNVVVFYAAAVAFGLSWVITGPLTSTLLVDYFGSASIGTLYGTVMLIHQVGSALGAFLAGLSFDLLGSYTWAFLAASAVVLAGSIAVHQIPEQRGGEAAPSTS